VLLPPTSPMTCCGTDAVPSSSFWAVSVSSPTQATARCTLLVDSRYSVDERSAYSMLAISHTSWAGAT